MPRKLWRGVNHGLVIQCQLDPTSLSLYIYVTFSFPKPDLSFLCCLHYFLGHIRVMLKVSHQKDVSFHSLGSSTQKFSFQTCLMALLKVLKKNSLWESSSLASTCNHFICDNCCFALY